MAALRLADDNENVFNGTPQSGSNAGVVIIAVSAAR